MQITPQWAKALENRVLNMEVLWRQILRADRSTNVNTDFKLHLEAPWTASPVLGGLFCWWGHKLWQGDLLQFLLKETWVQMGDEEGWPGPHWGQ